VDASEQVKWDAWCNAHIENRFDLHIETLGNALGHIKKELREEISAVRNTPIPLFAGPDDRLVRALAGTAESLEMLRKDVGDLRRDQGKQAERGDIETLRNRFIQKISELEAENEVAEKNIRALNTTVFNLSKVRWATAARLAPAGPPLASKANRKMGGTS
jgi:hypothetical protein